MRTGAFNPAKATIVPLEDKSSSMLSLLLVAEKQQQALDRYNKVKVKIY